MADREKVIRGLEACNRQSYNGSDCQNCPYYDDEDTAELPFGMCNIQDMFDDALALLKEQEPRVMTMEEAEASEEMVWVEFNSTHDNKLALEYVKVRRTEHFPDAFTLTTDSGIAWLRNRDDYNRGIWFGIDSGWRCWTAHPTVRQRIEVKWDG